VTDESSHRDTSPAERWRRVEDILAAAIECDGDARRQLVAYRCAGDAELAGDVKSLLAAHNSAGPIDRLTEAVAPAVAWARDRARGWEGRRVGQYRIEDLLGAGGMGLVYRARDERLGRCVALKFLSPSLCDNTAARQRFLDEARVAAALDHPNVCAIFEIGATSDGQPFIAMPLYDGETLRTRLKRGPLPFADALPIATQIARALSSGHERGIVHCDVKPSNVIVLADNTAKLLDFGVATMDSLPTAADAPPGGTVAYMSPEQLHGGAVDHRADIWALGILLHEMLTGMRPFDGDDRRSVTRAILSEHPNLVATSHPDVPAAVDCVLRRALARRPEDRYPTMEAFAAELAALRIVDGRPPAATAHEPLRGGDRRRAAVLVTIVSEYAALLEHSAPADAHRLITQVRNAAVDVVRRHGGLVNHAIGGDIVSLFGVPAAHEDDDVRSVRAAIELHARVGELWEAGSRTAAVRLQSGVHVGSVVAHRLNDGPQRFAITGAPAQLAAKLAASAQPGHILLSTDCQRLVGPFVLTAPCAGVIHETGGEPVRAFRVTGETGLETRLEASTRSGLTPFVGRASELARLEAQVARARQGDGARVVVVGEAGSGKSRLLHELRERAIDQGGIRLLHGRCRGYEVAPYCPFVDVVRDALDLRTLATRDAGEIADRVRAIDPSLDTFLPLYLHMLSVSSDRHPLPRQLQGEDLHAALIDGLASMIAALAARSTVVVLLEDWHWADTASHVTLDRMTDMVTGRPVLFVITTRPERQSLARLRTSSAQIPLEPLDFAAAAAIMRAVLRVDRVSASLASQVFERSSGNPFFVEQICCALVEQRTIEDRDGEATLNGEEMALRLPETVQAVIRTRLDALDPIASEVLRVAAVIGRDFPHTLLADALDPAIDLATAIALLEAAGLIQLTAVQPDVVYRFRHLLTHEVSYESLLAYQRTSLHERVGRAIESRERGHVDDAAVLAHHFQCAGLWPEAIRYGRRAAERASALSQFADALTILDRVLGWLEHLPDGEAKRDLKADLLLQYERTCETPGLRRQREVAGEWRLRSGCDHPQQPGGDRPQQPRCHAHEPAPAG
jgi:class 3 adenylate cyclase